MRHALAAVLRRRPEAAHATLLQHAAVATAAAPSGTTSIHELIRVKEPGLADLIQYDAYERRSGHVRFLEPATTPASWADATAAELGDFLVEPFEMLGLDETGVVVRRDGSVQGGAGSVPSASRKPSRSAGTGSHPSSGSRWPWRTGPVMP